MNLCSIEKSKQANEELEAVYQSLLKKIHQKNRAFLVTAKESWENFRKQQCKFNTIGTIDGSVNPMVVSSCYTHLTHNYMKLLKEQLYCEEGNLSCAGK